MRKTSLVVMFIVALVFASRSVKADTIFTNLVLGQNYNNAVGDPVTGTGIKNGRQGIVFAVQFTPAADFAFTDAKLALGLIAGTNSVDVYLQSDCGGMPCAVIEEIVLNQALKSGSGSIVIANSAQEPVLHSGAHYWLVLAAGTSDTEASWFVDLDNDFATSTDFDISFTGGPNGPWEQFGDNQLRPAFEIDGSRIPRAQTPEPTSLLLAVTGLAGLMIGKRMRKQGILSRQVSSSEK